MFLRCKGKENRIKSKSTGSKESVEDNKQKQTVIFNALDQLFTLNLRLLGCRQLIKSQLTFITLDVSISRAAQKPMLKSFDLEKAREELTWPYSLLNRCGYLEISLKLHYNAEVKFELQNTNT